MRFGTNEKARINEEARKPHRKYDSHCASQEEEGAEPPPKLRDKFRLTVAVVVNSCCKRDKGEYSCQGLSRALAADWSAGLDVAG